jgi:hypothetical protein
VSRDRTHDTAPQGDSPLQNLTEQLFGPYLGQAWIAESSRWDGCFYSREAVAAFSPDSRHHVSCALMKPGSKSRDKANFDGAILFVLDDVGVVAAPGILSISNSRVDRGALKTFAPGGYYAVETSPGNFQVGWRIEVEKDLARWEHFIRSMGQHPVYGRGVHDVVHYFRMETGSGKPEKGAFKTRLAEPWDGTIWKLDDLARHFGIDMSPEVVAATNRPLSTSGGVKAVGMISAALGREIIQRLPNRDKDKHFEDRTSWIGIAHALRSAVGEAEGRDLWLEWNGMRRQTPGEPERVWDTLPADSANDLNTLRWWLKEIHDETSKIFTDIVHKIADEQAPLTALDDTEVDAIPMPEGKKETPPDPSEFDLSDWNPWAKSGSVPFPVDTLPQVIADYVVERSQATGTDVSAFAVSALVCLGTAIDHRTKLQPKTHDPYYLVSPLLWALLVGAPSTRKSAPINAVEAILSKLDHRDSLQRKMAVHDMAVLFGIPEKEADKQVPPARRRVLYDATSEKLCSVLSGQDCGVGLFRDELSGWIGAWDKYSGGKGGAAQDRGVWIRAHGGGRYVQDRISGSRMVTNLSCSVLGAIQPMAIPDMGALDTDGLLQRLLPVMMSPAADDLDVAGGSWAGVAFEGLVETLDREPPETVSLDVGAQALRVAFAREMVRASGLTTPSASFGSFMGKQERTLCAVALILHKASGGGSVVDAGVMGRAVRIMEEFVLPHAYTFYVSLDADWLPATQSVAADLIKHSGGGKITQSALRSRAVRAMSLRDFQTVMRAFQGNGWVIAEDTGPMNRHWWVNPELYKFDQELKMYEKRSDEIVRKITKAAKKTP